MSGGCRSEVASEAVSSAVPSGRALSLPELRPRIGIQMVERGGLVARLQASPAPLVVLSAPAGSGKTTVLIQWTQREPRSHAWLQLESAHNAPLALATDLAAVLGHVAVVDPSIHRWTRSAVPPLKERILPSLRASLLETQPFLLVLDDAHFLSNKSSWDIIETLFDAFPPGAQLAIGTRTEPPLPLARLEAAECLLQMGGVDLAFSVEETAQLIDLRGLHADEATTKALRAATEGWAAGISLAVLACDRSCTSEWVAGIDGRQRAIARYLTSEVLERQDPAVRSFLLETSVLTRLSDGCCCAVTGRTDSGRLLAQLSRDNVFLIPLDEKEEWYRYHHLFAELLQAELGRQDGIRIPELHRRAAAWWEAEGDLEQAVLHWLAAGEVKRAGDVVCLGHLLYSGQGRIDTVCRWIELFTLEQIRSHVPLALVAGLIATMMRGSVPEWVNIALTVPTDDTPIPYADGTTRAWQAMVRALEAPDGAVAMRKNAELSVELGAGCHPAWSAAANIYLGAARWLASDLLGAEKAFRQSIEDGYQVNINARVAAVGYLSLLLADQGRWEEAEAESLRAKQWFDEAELGFQAPVITVPLAEARVLAHRGASVPEDSLATIENDLADFQLPFWIELITTVNLALAALDMGDIARAERWTAQSESILQAWPDAGILRTRVEQLRRTLLERRHVEALTPAEQRVLELLATHLTLPEIARKLVVSQNTVKTHVRDLYRKLDAHSRTAAVERSRELGLTGD